jgi:vacuolar-type H+-ATPase subunit H
MTGEQSTDGTEKSSEKTAREYSREAEDAVENLARDFDYYCDVEHAELARDLTSVLEALRHVLDHDLSDGNIQNALRTVARRHIDLRETEAVRPSQEWFNGDESSTDTEQEEVSDD